MSNIDSSIRQAAYQPGLAEEAALAARGKKTAQAGTSLANVAHSQAEAARTLASVDAFKTTGMQRATVGAASVAAQGQLRSDLAAAEAHQSVDIYAIMGLIQKSAQEMRNVNREIRAGELDAQVGEFLSAADDMQEAATFRLAAGIVQGSVQMLAAGAQAVGSIRAAQKSAQAMNPQSQAAQLKDSAQKMNDCAAKFTTEAQDLRTQAGVAKSRTTVQNLQAKAQAAEGKADYLRTNARSMDKMVADKQAQVDGFNESARSLSSNGDTAGKLLGGLGEIATSGLKFAADSADASARRHEARAKLHESASAGANEMMQQMMDVIHDVKDKLDSIDQSRIETTRDIARNI